MRRQFQMLAVVAMSMLAMSCGNKPQQTAESSANETATESVDVVKGELGLFELRGPVKECTMKSGDWYKVTLSFDENGMWTHEDGKPLSEKFPGGIRRDEKGRIVHGGLNQYEDLHIAYTYNADGLAERIDYAEYMDGGSIETREYDANGNVTALTVQLTGLDAYNEETGEEEGPMVNACTIEEKDGHGNWTRRKCGETVQTRDITYY